MKLAFCFLLYDYIEHEELWKKFFEGAPKSKYNIYSHIKEITDRTPRWIIKTKVRTVETGWCHEGLVYAFNEMLKKALKDNQNRYFILVSGTCIPVKPFNEIYNSLKSDKRARMTFLLPNPVKHRQWVILNRKTAKDLIRLNDPKDKKAQDFLSYTRYTNYTCPDETFPLRWFQHLYGKKINDYIKNERTTYDYWVSDKEHHPLTLNLEETMYLYSDIEKALFARKFEKDAAEYIAKMAGIYDTSESVKRSTRRSSRRSGRITRSSRRGKNKRRVIRNNMTRR